MSQLLAERKQELREISDFIRGTECKMGSKSNDRRVRENASCCNRGKELQLRRVALTTAAVEKQYYIF